MAPAAAHRSTDGSEPVPSQVWQGNQKLPEPPSSLALVLSHPECSGRDEQGHLRRKVDFLRNPSWPGISYMQLAQMMSWPRTFNSLSPTLSWLGAAYVRGCVHNGEATRVTQTQGNPRPQPQTNDPNSLLYPFVPATHSSRNVHHFVDLITCCTTTEKSILCIQDPHRDHLFHVWTILFHTPQGPFNWCVTSRFMRDLINQNTSYLSFLKHTQ